MKVKDILTKEHNHDLVEKSNITEMSEINTKEIDMEDERCDDFDFDR